MDNQQDKAKTYIVGGAFITLGILLLASLLNMLNAMSVYGYAIPILMILAGFTLVSAKDKTMHHTVMGLGFLLTGIIALLVRFNVISGKTVNAVLGTILFFAGIFIIVRMADKHAVKNTDS